jgi:hypothetical protein
MNQAQISVTQDPQNERSCVVKDIVAGNWHQLKQQSPLISSFARIC